MGLGSKLFQSFRNLKSDAVPRPPRPETFNINIDNEATDKDDDTDSIDEEIIIEPDEDHEHKNDNKKSKSKKSFFFNKKDKEKHQSHKSNNEPTTPVNTQATGNVINIVNSSNVHWGNVIHNNLGGTNTNWQQKYTNDSNMEVKKTNNIILLMEATIKPKHVHIDYIAKNLGKNWHSFFKALGYTQGRIETMEIDEARNGVSEARYKLLLDWTRNDDEGTLGKLATLLWQEGERQIVKELAVIYKKNNS